MFHLSRPRFSDPLRRPSRQGNAVLAQATNSPAVQGLQPERRNRKLRRPMPTDRPDSANVSVALFSGDGQLLSLTNERQELLCSVIGLLVKLGLVAVASVSLIRLAGAYQQRMERQGEISAVLELEMAQMAKARQRFDLLFNVEGEQRLIREQSQWIAPNRLRVVWQQPQPKPKPLPTVETAQALPAAAGSRP